MAPVRLNELSDQEIGTLVEACDKAIASMKSGASRNKSPKFAAVFTEEIKLFEVVKAKLISRSSVPA